MRSASHRLLLSALLTLLFPCIAAAQSIGSTDFSLSVTPQYPAPYGSATIAVTSSSINLANATITASVNGKQVYAGDVQPFSITLGGAGSTANVQVSLTSNGAATTQSLTVSPEDVSVVAEPVSSEPPLYPGKPSVPLEGGVRVVAVANFKDASGRALSPAALSYSWTIDGTQIADASGIGKTALTVASPLQYRARTVSVVVMSQDGSLVGGGSLALAPFPGTVRLYENDPLLGIRFDHALSGTYAITGTESSLYGAAYSFPLVNGAPNLAWYLNGSAAQTGPTITLRPTGSGQGTASLSLVASLGDLPPATQNLSLSFGAAASNFFGL